MTTAATAEKDKDTDKDKDRAADKGKGKGKARGKAADKTRAVGLALDPGACTCPICGEAATFDVAPNPGPTAGGPPAPPFPPPEGMNVPEAEDVPQAGPWYLVLCTNVAHRTLWPEADMDQLITPEPPVGGTVQGGGTPTQTPAHGHGGAGGGSAGVHEGKK